MISILCFYREVNEGPIPEIGFLDKSAAKLDLHLSVIDCKLPVDGTI